MKFRLIGMLLFIGIELSAQSIELSQISPIIGMSVNASVQSALFDFLLNPANLESIKKLEVGISATQKYGLRQMNDVLFSIAKQNPRMNIGLALHKSGSTLYNEVLLGVHCSKKLQKNVELGIQFEWQKRSIKESYVDNQIQFGIGSIFQLSDQLRAGISIKKTMYLSASQKNNLPANVDVIAGLCYQLSKQFFIAIDAIKLSNFHATARLLASYDISKKITCKYGFESGTGTQFWGFGFDWKKIHVFTNVAYHPQLGAYPGLVITSKNNQSIKIENK